MIDTEHIRNRLTIQFSPRATCPFLPFSHFLDDLFANEECITVSQTTETSREWHVIGETSAGRLFIVNLMARMHSLNSHFRGKRRGTGIAQRKEAIRVDVNSSVSPGLRIYSNRAELR